MRSKIFFLSVAVFLFMFLLLNINFSSAALCSVTDRVSCTGSNKIVLKLSETGNAHGAPTTQTNFPADKVVCCDFGDGGTSCTGTNKFLGLSGSSGSGNSHGETPKTLTEYSTLSYTSNNACYSVKDCRATTSNCVTSGPQENREVEMLRLSSLGNAQLGNSASGYSQKVCCKLDELPNTIHVESPNLGTENWEVGTQQTITWTYTGTIANVNIEISRDNGLTWDSPMLFSSTTNDGSESWTVTSPATTQALIRISDTFTAATNDVSDAPFTISSPVGSGCTITDAYWERGGAKVVGENKDNIIVAGNNIQMAALGGAECDGQTASFDVRRSYYLDIGTGEYVGTDEWTDGSIYESGLSEIPGVFSGTKASATWTTTHAAGISNIGYQKYRVEVSGFVEKVPRENFLTLGRL